MFRRASSQDPEEDRELIADAWDIYRRIPRVGKTVDLHAAAFAFRAVQVHVTNGDSIEQLPVQVPRALLRDIGINLFVAGTARADVQVEQNRIRMVSGDRCEFRYNEGPSFAYTPPGALWSLARNHEALTKLLSSTRPQYASVAAQIADHLLLGMLPPELLSTERAASLTPYQIEFILQSFHATVRRMKDSFAWQLESTLKPQLSVVDVSWEPSWQVRSAVLPGLVDLARVYQVFKSEGIELISLKNQARDIASQLLEVGIIARDKAELITALYDQ